MYSTDHSHHIKPPIYKLDNILQCVNFSQGNIFRKQDFFPKKQKQELTWGHLWEQVMAMSRFGNPVWNFQTLEVTFDEMAIFGKLIFFR